MDWDLTESVAHGTGGRSNIVSLQATKQTKQPLAKQPANQNQNQNQNQDHEKNYQIALKHANIIEQRKRIEKSILDSTIKLIDYPSSRTADPAKPSVEDAVAVKQHLRLFQPYDYDELIQERNIEKQCGYVLCPRPHKATGKLGEWTILHRGRDLKVVKTSEVMRWCSDDCTRRAMFLRVQLDETPAWERIKESRLELADGDPSLESGEVLHPSVDRDAVAKVAEDLKLLALERGNPNANVDTIMTDVREKTLPHR